MTSSDMPAVGAAEDWFGSKRRQELLDEVQRRDKEYQLAWRIMSIANEAKRSETREALTAAMDALRAADDAARSTGVQSSTRPSPPGGISLDGTSRTEKPSYSVLLQRTWQSIEQGTPGQRCEAAQKLSELQSSWSGDEVARLLEAMRSTSEEIIKRAQPILFDDVKLKMSQELFLKELKQEVSRFVD